MVSKKLFIISLFICFLIGGIVGKTLLQKEVPQPITSQVALIESPVIKEQIVSNEQFDSRNNSVVYEYHLQLGAFKVPYFAQQLANKVKKRGYTVNLEKVQLQGQDFLVVEVGPFKKFHQANKHKKFIMGDNPTLGKVLIKKRIKN